MMRSVALLSLLMLTACQTAQSPAVVNSFCAAYHRVIRTEGEGSSLHAADRTVKERIAANETLYRCECEHWDNPVCSKQ